MTRTKNILRAVGLLIPVVAIAFPCLFKARQHGPKLPDSQSITVPFDDFTFRFEIDYALLVGRVDFNVVLVKPLPQTPFEVAILARRKGQPDDTAVSFPGTIHRGENGLTWIAAQGIENFPFPQHKDDQVEFRMIVTKSGETRVSEHAFVLAYKFFTR